MKFSAVEGESLSNKIETPPEVQSIDSTRKRPAERNQFDVIPTESWDQYNSYKDPASAMLTIATFAATITFNIILTPRANGQATPGLDLLAYANSLFCGCIIGCILITIAIELCNDSKELNKKMGELDKKREQANHLLKEMEQQNIGDIWSSPLIIWPSRFLRRFSIGIIFLEIPSWLKISTAGLSVFITIISGVVGVMLLVAFYLMIYATRLYLEYNRPFILGSVIYFSFGAIAILLWIRNLWCKWLLDMAASGGDKVIDFLKNEKERMEKEENEGKKKKKKKGRPEKAGEKTQDVEV